MSENVHVYEENGKMVVKIIHEVRGKATIDVKVMEELDNSQSGPISEIPVTTSIGNKRTGNSSMVRSRNATSPRIIDETYMVKTIPRSLAQSCRARCNGSDKNTLIVGAGILSIILILVVLGLMRI